MHQLSRLTGRGICFRETVTCVPKRIGRWVFANSTRSVAATIEKTTIIRWPFFYCGWSSILTGAERLFDGTRGKRAIFLCNEVDTRGRFASARRRHLFPCRFNQKRCCIGSPLLYWDACFDTKQASFFLHPDILKSLVFLTSFTRLLFRLLQKTVFLSVKKAVFAFDLIFLQK